MAAAIETKYISATNTRGSRIKATCAGMTASVPYDHSLSEVQAHFAAVAALKEKHKCDHWNIEKMNFGGTKAGFVFVFPFSYVEQI